MSTAFTYSCHHTIEYHDLPDEGGRVRVEAVVDGDRVADAITVGPEAEADVLGAVPGADPLRQHGEPRRPRLREGDEGAAAGGDVGPADVDVVGAGDVARVDAGVVGRLQAAPPRHAVVEGARAGGRVLAAAPPDSSARVGAFAVPERCI